MKQSLTGFKKDQENILVDYAKKYKKRVVIARIFNVYGPNQKDTFIVPTILSQLDKCFVELGNISYSRDYIFISDVISALTLLKDSKAEDFLEVYNIGSGQPTTVRDLINEFEFILKREIIIKQVKKKIRKENILEYSDCSRLKKLNWKQNISLKRGLLTCYNHWREDKWK